MGCGDIEKNQLISTGSVVAASQLHWITGIAQSHEVDAFDHPSGSHVEAGNDPFGNHNSWGKDRPGRRWYGFRGTQSAPPMSQAATSPAITVGSKVKVTRVRDRIKGDLVKLLLTNPEGVVTGFKMTDGSGVGVKVKLDDGTESWFFEDEIAAA